MKSRRRQILKKDGNRKQRKDRSDCFDYPKQEKTQEFFKGKF